MEFDVINTTNGNEIIGSTYADIYLNYDTNKLKTSKDIPDQKIEVTLQDETVDDVWKSPSDLLIGKIQLQPPFTSKIIKSKTHEGIISIGDDILQKEHQEFLVTLKNLLQDNDDCWKFVVMNEMAEIQNKVKIKYQSIFKTKSGLMTKEMDFFYENTLRELEDHIKNEVETVLSSVHANMTSYLNNQIRFKMRKERKKLENILNIKYLTEIRKIKRYYTLLLKGETEKASRLTNYALKERNNAIDIFYKQILRERLTTSMYTMCTERKKCKVKKILLEKYHGKEVGDVIEKIKERRNLLQSFEKNDICISDINKDWEDKIKKVLQLFLKFISFSLKLLPEQTTFLLQLEKMVQLQLDEVRTSDKSTSSVLLEDYNMFNFVQPDPSQSICTKQPFVIEGDMSATPTMIYGSRETIPSDVDLPYLRLQRQFVYAKCHGFDEIKKFLDSQRCKCRTPSQVQVETPTSSVKLQPAESSTTKSSDEFFLFENFHRIEDCPVRKCMKMLTVNNSFLDLNPYLDFSEENYKRVEAILGGLAQKEIKENLLEPKDIANSELPFSKTKEKYHTVETQCSSDEDISYDAPCPCIHTKIKEKTDNEAVNSFITTSITDTCIKRKKMIKEITKRYPHLIKVFAEHDINLETYVKLK